MQSSISYSIQTSHLCAQLKLLAPLDTLVGGGQKHEKSLVKLVFGNLNNNILIEKRISKRTPNVGRYPKMNVIQIVNFRKTSESL